MEWKEIKIRPIKGYEKLTYPGYPDDRDRELQNFVKKIKEILREKIGIEVTEIKGSRNSLGLTLNTRYYPFYHFYYDEEELFTIGICPVGTLLIIFNGWREGIKEIEIECKNYDEKFPKSGLIKIYHNRDFIPIFLYPHIQRIDSTIFSEIDKISKEGIINFDELIIYFVGKIREIKPQVEKELKKLYNKTKKAIEENEDIKKIPIIRAFLNKENKLDESTWKEGLHYPYPRGWILWLDDRLKFVSGYESVEEYRGKVEIKEIQMYYKLYIYEELEKISFEIKEETKIDFLTLEDFLSQCKNLSKYNIYFSEEILKNFYAGINSGNRFLILAGATGTGKTLLALIFPAIKHRILDRLVKECEDENSLKEKIHEELRDYLCFLRVAPNWTSTKDVIGFYNPITDQLVKGPLYDFLIRANEEKNDFFLILDEMNLSHPEHYLSDILSAMETRGEINIHNERIRYPKNLYIIGTINIDETTKELSPRLKSRAFVLYLRADFENYIRNCDDKEEREVAEILKIIDDHLSKIDLGLGYRDIKHITQYKKQGGDIDDALIQKIIPRIRSTDEKFIQIIEDLIKDLEEKFPECHKFCNELEKLKEKFISQGFV